MPITSAAKKALKRSKKLQARNQDFRVAMKQAIKTFERAVEEKKKKGLDELLNNAVSAIDKAQRKNILHKNTAARWKSRLTRLYNEATGE